MNGYVFWFSLKLITLLFKIENKFIIILLFFLIY